MNILRSVKIGVTLVGALFAALALATVALLNFDWNHARPWLNERVSQAIGRPFSIDGALALSWHAPIAPLPGWRGMLPWPRLVAQDIRIGNPAGNQSAGTMAQIARLTFSLSPLPLLGKKIVIPLLQLEAPQLELQRNAAGENNWTFAPHSESAWQLELQALALKDGSVHLVDAIRRADIHASIESVTENGPPGYGVAWRAHGKLGAENLTASGKAGSILSLQNQVQPYPVQATLQVGKTSIAVQGSLTGPSKLAAMDLRLHLAGVSMAHLYIISGFVMPETAPYSTEGHLIGTMGPHGGHWTYEKFSGHMGGSDIAGTLEFQGRAPRPLLTGSVVSKLLRLQDLSPLIGADTKASKVNRGAPTLQPAGKVLPVERFKSERWTSIDADVHVSGNKIVRQESSSVDSLQAHVLLHDGILTLAPLDFSVADGRIRSNITLDGRQPAIKAQLKLTGRHLNLSRLFPDLTAMQSSLGQLDTDATLSASGYSIASMLATSNGELKAQVDQGTISKLLIEKIGLNIGNVVLGTLTGDRQIKLNCIAGDFAVTNGLMRTRSLVVETEAANLHVSGAINLGTEQLALVIQPHGKGLRIITLRTPLYVAGTFKQPVVTVDKGVVALKAGAALALLALSPFAAMLPLANLGQQEQSACTQAAAPK